MKQKKLNEELKIKSKSLYKELEESEMNAQNLQDLENELENKKRYIKELEARLNKKNQEY